MRVPTLHVILLLAALVGVASAGRRHWEMMRQKCCANPNHNMCRVALERWHFCQDAKKNGKRLGTCGDFGQASTLSLIACRPGIDAPPDWKDEEKPRT